KKYSVLNFASVKPAQPRGHSGHLIVLGTLSFLAYHPRHKPQRPQPRVLLHGNSGKGKDDLQSPPQGRFRWRIGKKHPQAVSVLSSHNTVRIQKDMKSRHNIQLFGLWLCFPKELMASFDMKLRHGAAASSPFPDPEAGQLLRRIRLVYTRFRLNMNPGAQFLFPLLLLAAAAQV